jgi:sarcosine oxidase subunit delta
MSFLVPCPNCGRRSVYEFRFGGEVRQIPALDATETEWRNYRFNRTNSAGVQTEWWFHRFGCREWLQVVRNTVSNEVLAAYLPREKH